MKLTITADYDEKQPSLSNVTINGRPAQDSTCDLGEFLLVAQPFFAVELHIVRTDYIGEEEISHIETHRQHHENSLKEIGVEEIQKWFSEFNRDFGGMKLDNVVPVGSEGDPSQ